MILFYMLFVITYHLVEARKIAMMCLSVVCRPMPVSVCLSVCLSVCELVS